MKPLAVKSPMDSMPISTGCPIARAAVSQNSTTIWAVDHWKRGFAPCWRSAVTGIARSGTMSASMNNLKWARALRQAPAAPAAADGRVASAVAQSLAGCNEEERFLLASYYLDGQTLADIGRQLRVHESTISRKLTRLTGDLRKRVRKRLLMAGVDGQQCDELLHDLEVRDLNVDIEATLRQESSHATFYKEYAVYKKGCSARLDATRIRPAGTGAQSAAPG